MKIKSLRFLIILCPIFLSCNTYDILEKDPMVISVFNAKEITDLNKILNFFEKEICTDSANCSSKKGCYENFLTTLDEGTRSAGDFRLDMSYEKQKEMYSSIDTNLFKEIWSFNKSFPRYLKDTLDEITLSTKGKYSQLLTKMGADDSAFFYYKYKLIRNGEFQGLIPMILHNYEYFSYRNARERLFYAIHYITVNDLGYRNKEILKLNVKPEY